MALDFALLGNDGAPEVEIDLPIDVHYDLMQWARELKLKQLLKLRSYYRDVDFSRSDTQLLATEVAIVRRRITIGQLSAFLSKLDELLKVAHSSERTIHAIAD